MIKRIHIQKKSILVCIVAAAAVILVLAAVFFRQRESRVKNGITVAEAAKMIACAAVEEMSVFQNKQEGYWYEPYVAFVKERGLLEIASAKRSLTYADVRCLLKQIGANTALDQLSSENGAISRQAFVELYLQVLSYFEYGSQIEVVEAGIAGTPANLNNTGEWEAATTKGVFRFTGMVLDDKMDQTVRMVVRQNEILTVASVVADGVTYRNVWVESSDNNQLKLNIYGAERQFQVRGLTEPVSGVLSDIEIAEGKVVGIHVKTDTISGKVLSVTADYVEIDGYGKVRLDEFFMIYDISAGFSVKNHEDIVVGYALQDFIVADGKICGAVISKGLDVDNIRVIVKTSGFGSIFHDVVHFTCDVPFRVSYGEQVEQHAAGEEIAVDRANVWFNEGRVTIEPEGGQTRLISVNRSQGNPSYEGKVELSLFEEGIVVVNDVDIENYLKRVVPSEMPVSFGVEALKVQAVCARSYAYQQLTNSFYSAYGAHVDDSTLYQVYNNTTEQEASNEAIRLTKGQVLKYQGSVVQAYYYSTSCGAGTDVGLWGSDPAAYPYFVSRDIGRTERNLDLADEQTFEAFITAKDEQDYDYNCALYRWTLPVSCEELSTSFNAKLYERYLAVPERILTQEADGSFVSKPVKTVGQITDIAVNRRVGGGAAVSVTVTGSEATVKIESESCIRSLLGVGSQEMTTNTGTTTMASLPSTFCIFRKTYSDGVLSGFEMIGGGYGHGIGMSQNAVNVMARENMSYIQILQYFYPGTEVAAN